MAKKPVTTEEKKQTGEQRLLLIIILFCILGIAFFAFSFLSQFFAPPQSSTTPPSQLSTQKNYTPPTAYPTQKIDAANCMAARGIPENKIIEIYSPTCPRSQAMQPHVRALEAEGFEFHQLNIADNAAQNIINECLGELISGYTPQFICLKKNTQLTGETTRSALKTFVSDCIS